MKTWTNENHIVPETCCTDTQQQNGTAEVGGKCSTAISREMQLTGNTGENLEAALFHYALYIENRLYSQALAER